MTIVIGDRVTNTKQRFGYATGRVTGFAPNGSCRVKLDDGSWRIWPTERLILARGEAHHEHYDWHVRMWRLKQELTEWVARIGEERARTVCNLVWPNRF